MFLDILGVAFLALFVYFGFRVFFKVDLIEKIKGLF